MERVRGEFSGYLKRFIHEQRVSYSLIIFYIDPAAFPE